MYRIPALRPQIDWSFRYPPSAPLIEQPPTPPASPDASEGSSSEIPVQDWSKLPPESAYFLGVNRGRQSLRRSYLSGVLTPYMPGKRSFGVNLKTREGQDLVRQLVSQADVLVSALVEAACSVDWKSDIYCYRWKTTFLESLMN